MNQYRTKENPFSLVTQPLELPVEGQRISRSIHGAFGDSIMFQAGYYKDVSVAPDDSQKYSDAFVWDEEAGTVTRLTVATPAEEIAETLAYEINSIIDQICIAAERWVTTELNAAGMIMVEKILAVEPDNTKALASFNWVRSEYYEAEIRKYYVSHALWAAPFDPADFSMRVKKPYVVAELDVEFSRLFGPPIYVP